jgi:anti-anti-sigma factor
VIDDADPRLVARTEPAADAAPDQPVPCGEPGAVQVILGEDRVRVVLSGDVDSELGDELAEAAAEAERHDLPIEVDAHHVTFMDSAGVAFLTRLSTRSRHPVRLLRVPPTVRFLLEVTKIGEVVEVAPDDDAPPFRPLV